MDLLKAAAFTDFRNLIKRRLAYAEYCIGSTFYRADFSEIEITAEGIVRVKIPISHGAAGTITQVRLISVTSEVWASKENLNIVLETAQTHYLQWFDFNITESEG